MMRFTLLAVLGAALCIGQLALADTTNPAPTATRLATIAQTLSLTADQQTKAKAIFKSTHEAVKAVLTPDQLAALKASKGETPLERIKGLNLTADQKMKIKAAREAGLAAFKAILTSDQQAKLTQLLAAKKQARQAKKATK